MRAPRVITLAVAIFMSACGGGGGGSNGSANPPPVNPPPVNQAPTVDAGADQSADEGSTINLSGTGTDVDGNIASYSWQQDSGPTVTITNVATANASFAAPMVTATEVLIFRITVADDDGATGSDTVSVSVNDTNPSPPPSGDFVPLGYLLSSDEFSTAIDVSDDGSVVVGFTENEAFRWTSTTGMVGLGDLPGGTDNSQAHGVSADGSIVVGQSNIAGPNLEAFRWTASTGMVGLGIISSEAQDISADGSIIVGSSSSQGLGQEAFRWTSASGIVWLGDLPGGQRKSQGTAVSADGSVVVGLSDSNIGSEAYRWSSATGMVGLALLNSRAHAVSADGSVIVGSGDGGSGSEAVLWTSAGGMMGLGYLPGQETRSQANSVSADGRVVVGASVGGACLCMGEAFVWTQTDGMQSLRDVLIAKGVTGLDNWELRVINSISADGEWVVGMGVNPSGIEEAFLAYISAP